MQSINLVFRVILIFFNQKKKKKIEKKIQIFINEIELDWRIGLVSVMRHVLNFDSMFIKTN